MPNRPSLRRRFVAVVFCAAIAMGSALGTGTATADQHNQKSCEEAGGIWTSGPGGAKSCTFTETEDGKNDRFQCTTTDTTTGQANLGNRTGESSSTSGEGTGSGKCPKGQFPE